MIHIFIINTLVVDRTVSDKIKEHLINRTDIRYFTFNTSHAGMESEITKKMIRFFEGERLRFYCCGGSGTLRNIMDASGDYKDMEVAFFPCGKTNDFLKVFGDDEKYFHDIDNLIDGNIEQVDYIKTNHGVALNTVSFGLDTILSKTLEDVSDYDIFGKKIPFIISYAKSIIKTKPRKLQIRIDDNLLTKNVSEIIIGNGMVLGGGLHFSGYADYSDGMADYCIALEIGSHGMLKLMARMTQNDIPYVKENTYNGKGSYFEIKTPDGSPIDFNLDGEIISGNDEWKIEIIRQGMNFVVPKAVGKI